jgi:hypothetical protein
MAGTLMVLLMAACAAPGGQDVRATPAVDAPGAQAFDLDLVKSNFADECADPIVVDELFCQQVDIDGMTVQDGTTLIVPTLISGSGMEPRASVICEVFARVHFDGETGEDLGYQTIGILDREGGNAAECAVGS